jgi:AraC family transcriptional regulator
MGHMLKNLIDMLDLVILNIEPYQVHTEWQHEKVSSPYSRLYYFVEGEGHIYFHKQKKRYSLTPGTMYLIPCFTLVDLYCPDSFLHYYVHFTAYTQNGFDLLTLIDCTCEEPAASHGISRHHFDRLYQLNPGRELIERDANKPIYTSTLERARRLDQDRPVGHTMETNGLLRMLLAPFLQANNPDTISSTVEGLNRFESVIKHIQLHLTEELTLPVLAEAAGLHPTYFSNLFTKYMGISPIQYIQRMRIEKAQVLLLSSHENLDAIALSSGFEDTFYFSRVFKRLVGVSPGKYRRQNNEM